MDATFFEEEAEVVANEEGAANEGITMQGANVERELDIGGKKTKAVKMAQKDKVN